MSAACGMQLAACGLRVRPAAISAAAACRYDCGLWVRVWPAGEGAACRRMEASVAGFVLRHPGREWRRPCAAPSCEVGEGLCCVEAGRFVRAVF